MVVTPACNPNYLEGRCGRIESLRPAWAKLARPILKNELSHIILKYIIEKEEKNLSVNIFVVRIYTNQPKDINEALLIGSTSFH
jgi:hypothetical protein